MTGIVHRLAAKAVIRDRLGRVLLLRYGGAPGRATSGCWTLPGGRLEGAETLEGCVVREVREETGLKVRVVGGVHSGSYCPVVRGVPHRVTATYFLCEADGDTQPRVSDEHDQFRWVRLAALSRMVVVEPDRTAVVAAFVGPVAAHVEVGADEAAALDRLLSAYLRTEEGDAGAAALQRFHRRLARVPQDHGVYDAALGRGIGMTKPRGSRVRGMVGKALQNPRVRAETSALIEEGRAGKYRADVEFAEQDPYPQERVLGAARVARIRELAAQGLSRLKIATALDMDLSQLGDLMRVHGIRKGRPGITTDPVEKFDV